MSDDLVYRLRKRAEIRRNITTRKSVQNNEPDRIADLLDEAADAIEELMEKQPWWYIPFCYLFIIFYGFILYILGVIVVSMFYGMIMETFKWLTK